MKEKLYRASDIIWAIDKHTKDTPHGLVLDEDITIILEGMKSVEPDASVCWGCNCPKMEQKTFSEMVHLHDAETHDKRTGTHGVCLDTISRQAAIDKHMIAVIDGVEVVPVSYIKSLPSAQPVITCDGCRFVSTYDTDLPCCNCVRREKDYYAPER